MNKYALTFMLISQLVGCSSSDEVTETTKDQPAVGSVSGFTTESNTGAVNSDVSVSIDSKNVVSGIDGAYSITNVVTGQQLITASKTGYGNYSATITITENMTTTHEIVLTAITTIIDATQYKTCLEIINGGDSQGDSYYQIDVDGTGTLLPFVVYCDMTNEGGGWTLFARHEDGVASIVGVDEVDLIGNGVLRSDRWVALRNLMSVGMLFLDENSNISTLSSTKLLSGNCASVNDIDDLTNLQDPALPVDTGLRFIYHNEDVACIGAGGDYTLIKLLGDRTSNYNTHGAALFQGSTVKFDIWPYSNQFQSSLEQNLLYFFIK